MHTINFILNGDPVKATIEDNTSLLDFLRRDLGLTAAKKGCGEGECGACVVLLDGRSINSCLTLAVEVDGHEITTLEGLRTSEGLHPVQRQFIDKWAMQCGFCTPGMIMAAVSLLKDNPTPTEYEIRDGIAGNLCRCTGYAKIVEAIDAAAKELAGTIAKEA